MNSVKALNMGLAFLLELAMLVAFGYWGFQSNDSIWIKWGLGIGVPLAVAVVWGILLAPASKRRLSMMPGVVASLGLFWLSALALYEANQPVLAIGFAVIALVNRVLTVVWKQW